MCFVLIQTSASRPAEEAKVYDQEEQVHDRFSQGQSRKTSLPAKWLLTIINEFSPKSLCLGLSISHAKAPFQSLRMHNRLDFSAPRVSEFPWLAKN